MSDNNQIFLDFWNTFQWPEPVEVFYRLYHTAEGDPIVYSHEDLPGQYIEVTKEQYQAHDYRVRVKDGQLISRPQNLITTRKLIPADSGTTCHPTDITIVVDKDDNQKWKLKHYDNN